MSNRSKKTTVSDEEPGFIQSCLIKWSKALQPGAKWNKESFEDFPVCVHWFRQISSVIVGTALGIAGVTGAPGLVGGYGLVTVMTYFYYSGYIEADEYSFGESGLKFEGMMPSFAVFLLWWVICYTGMGHDLTGPTA